MVMSYGEAEAKLETARDRKAGKPLENNTRLVEVGETAFGIKLHATVVVTIHNDGTYELNSGGWRTVTTKDRINNYSPARVSQEAGIWYIATRLGWRIFEDGVIVDAYGEPVELPPDPEPMQAMKRELDRMVRSYIRGFAEHVEEHGLSEPDDGDCWGCYFNKTDMQRGEPYGMAMGADHILSHMEEKYYVPSLLANAIYTRGYTNPGFVWQMATDTRYGDLSMLKSILGSYFTKVKPKLLDVLMAREEVYEG